MFKKVLIISLVVSFSGLVFLGSGGCYSCKTMNKVLDNGPIDPASEGACFWDDRCKLAKGECGWFVTERYFPSKDSRARKVFLRKQMPKVINVGESFDYIIGLKNVGKHTLDVTIHEELVKGFKLTDSNPKGKVVDGSLIINVGKLKPNEVAKITITGVVSNEGCLTQCSTVTYVEPACTTLMALKPGLEITKTAPKKVSICDPIHLQFEVTNPGTGVARDVKITDSLPEGLVTSNGNHKFTLDIGDIEPKVSKKVTLSVNAEKTGTFTNKATATGKSLSAESNVTKTFVGQPVLKISKFGREMQYLGKPVEYVLEITNTGDWVAVNTIIRDSIPSNVSLVELSSGGKVVDSNATWSLGNLEPGQSEEVVISYVPGVEGVYANTATASAICAEAVSASVETDIQGISAVLLEVIDINDPVEISSNEIYIVTVTNQGTKAATNVLVKCFLEDNAKFVKCSGATKCTTNAGEIVFAPLASLAPKAKAIWKVTVQAVKPGDVRFKTTMNTDQIGVDVMETESTNFYN